MPAPKREWYKAAEVCEVASVQPYVLRSWEAEFPHLGQAPAGGGPRVYRRQDLELVLRIKGLVFGEGLTLAGARRRLEESAEPDAPPVMPFESALGDEAREKVRFVRDGLRGLLDMLRADQPPSFALAAPDAVPARRGGKVGRRRTADAG